ncbi:replication factor A protein [Trifolium medium]|uniref:Replication factor A protein n=1 Tax=Trifolium medium TaxID=97028 RepID=A0A392MA53_9FABA|nr:replication factor A protein [Trifolium medium]
MPNMHDKNYFDDNTVTQTVTIDLTDDKGTYQCELSRSFVDDFRKMVKATCVGLPIVVLQFAKITKQQGRTVVISIDHVTRLFVNPLFADAVNFRIGLVLALEKVPNYLGICSSTSIPYQSVTFDLKNNFPVRSISELKADPRLGIYIINARMVQMSGLDAWWYPVCGCRVIVESYIGGFFCETCSKSEFYIVPKYRVRVVVEDDSAATYLDAYDHAS